MKQCFGYVRVSTKKQGEGVSLEAQKDAICSFAKQNDLSIIQWFEEKETAAKHGRPIFNKMLHQLKKGDATGLIMHKIDRSARNMRDWIKVMELPSHGVKPYFAADGLDFETRGGRLSANLQAVIAEDYIFNLREETIKGLNGRLKQGLYPFPAPIGYIDNGKGNEKTPDPRYAPMIREMFELYACGQHSLRSLHAEMHSRGLRNTKGGPVSMCGVETIMSNPFYTGVIRIKRTGQIFNGVHKPIIPVALFRRVQDIKSGRSGKKVTRHNHLYRGMFRCGLCDSPMSPERQKGRIYYRCHTRTCATKTIHERTLEQAIVSKLRSLVICENQRARLSAKWDRDYAVSDVETKTKSLELRIADETTRLDRLTDLLIDGTLSKDRFQERENAAKMRLAKLGEKLAEMPNPKQMKADHMDFLELMNSLVLLYGLANPTEKRILVQNCFSNRTVIEKEPCFEPYSWLAEGQIDPSVLNGAPYRDTSRTGNGANEAVANPMELLKPLFEILKRHGSQVENDAA